MLPSGECRLMSVSCWICFSFDSPSSQAILCTPTVASPPPYLPMATVDIIHEPISNKTPPLKFCFVFNKSARRHPRIPVPFRNGFYHSAVDQIWHAPNSDGNSRGGYTHTVDLLAWYTGHSKTKYAPQDISHLSWNCHKPIFTTRTSTNWKRENTIATLPSKQSCALKASPHLSTQKCWTETAEHIPFLLPQLKEWSHDWHTEAPKA